MYPRYVSAIHFGDEKLSRQRLPPVTEVATSTTPASMATTIRVMPAIGEENADEISYAENFEHSNDFGDSIVTDSLLQMTSLSSKEQQQHQDVNIVHANQMESDSLEQEVVEEEGDTARRTSQSSAVGMARKSEDMDKVIMELTQAVIKSRNISTITKAMKNNSHGRNRSFRRGQILRNSVSLNCNVVL